MTTEEDYFTPALTAIAGVVGINIVGGMSIVEGFGNPVGTAIVVGLVDLLAGAFTYKVIESKLYPPRPQPASAPASHFPQALVTAFSPPPIAQKVAIPVQSSAPHKPVVRRSTEPRSRPGRRHQLSKRATFFAGTDPSPHGRFHADECVSGGVVFTLTLDGFDITSTEEVHLKKAKDEEQLAFAWGENRIIITNDHDFIGLHERGLRHCGIILAEGNDSQAAIEAARTFFRSQQSC